jgi:hypothetical protein
MPMKANEAITLDACLLALLHYGDSVPPNLHAQIQSANRQLSNGQPEAVKQLKNVIEQDERLKRLYTVSREHLVMQYGAQERAKSSAVAIASSSPAFNGSFTNGSTSAKVLIDFGSTSAKVSLLDLATAILSSPDANYRTTAQQVLNQPKLKKQLEQASEDLRVSAKEFSDAANQLHPTKVSIMQKLENNFYTPDDLAYSLEIPIESAQRYIKSLWNEGYIRPTSSNPFTQIWQSFKGAPSLTHPPDIDTPLTLTAKGHFYLHPGTLGRILSKKRRFA